MIIEPATPADARSIAQVHVDTWRTAYRGLMSDAFLAQLSYDARERRWQELLRDPKLHCLVCREKANVLGFATGGKVRGEIKGFDAELYAIYVMAEHQRRGIGGRLVRRLARGLQQSGFHSLVLWSLEGNANRGFYERMGGELLPFTQYDDFDGKKLREVAYGWRSLDGLTSVAAGEDC